MKTLKMMTDEELVVLYAEGNNAAFDILLIDTKVAFILTFIS